MHHHNSLPLTYKSKYPGKLSSIKPYFQTKFISDPFLHFLSFHIHNTLFTYLTQGIGSRMKERMIPRNETTINVTMINFTVLTFVFSSGGICSFCIDSAFGTKKESKANFRCSWVFVTQNRDHCIIQSRDNYYTEKG